MRTKTTSMLALVLCGLCLSVGTAYAQNKKPNILVIWGDDIARGGSKTARKQADDFCFP